MTDPLFVGTAVVLIGSLLFVAVLSLVGWWSRRRGGQGHGGGRP